MHRIDVSRAGRWFAPVIAIGLVSWVACGGGGGGGGGGTMGPNGGGELPEGDVTLTASSFQPENLTVEAGNTVTWVNSVTLMHTITPDGHAAWNRVELDQRGDTFDATFQQAGEFEYYCEIHGSPGAGMHGTITVNP